MASQVKPDAPKPTAKVPSSKASAVRPTVPPPPKATLKKAPVSGSTDASHTAAAAPMPASRLRQMAASGASLVLHILVLLTMALIINPVPPEEKALAIVSSAPEVAEEFEDEMVEEMPDQPQTDQEITDAVVLPDAVVVEDVKVISTADDMDAAPLSVELADFSTESAPSTDLLSTVGAIGGTQ